MAETFFAELIQDRELFDKVPIPDDYAFFHSGSYKLIAVKKKYEQKSEDSDLYVKVSYGKKKIYLKYHSAPVRKDTVLLTYSNFARLGTNGREDIPVSIKKSCSFRFSWFNGNSAARNNFRIAVCSLVVGALALFPEIYKLIKKFIDFLFN